MHYPNEIESANGRRLKKAIARDLQYQAVVLERYWATCGAATAIIPAAMCCLKVG
jgi:hypothetical protein